MAAFSSTLKSSWLMCLAVLVLALLAPQQSEAHMALLYPTPRGGFGTKAFDGRIHTFIGYQGLKYPCGGYPKGPVTHFKAGDLVDVRFWTPELKDVTKLPTKKMSQARHGGGLCEFSLSYDGGNSFNVIASYSKTCPDAFYKWPVRIPSNVPGCNKSGKCLFSWSWTANLVPQFYHNCADVTIQATSKSTRMPTQKMQKYDFKGVKQNVVFPGDGSSHGEGKGPLANEKAANSKQRTVQSNGRVA
ncbi:hypothetical protein BGZ99_008343 [Dissophora globulifera]|uniref:Uncharacterized protein n=1 Tax=Dissophora globulifera TaxID=979702 RepID=A0A9P6R9K1_9FUNG|nr:hypothetical protein BGZ99_008343 [Dissophora globulifera]